MSINHALVMGLLSWYMVSTEPSNPVGSVDGASLSRTSTLLPPPQWGALRPKVQELAPAPGQTTDQWAGSCIDRTTWAPEVPANPCSLSATLAAWICCLVQFSVEQTALWLWINTLTHSSELSFTHTSLHQATTDRPHLSLTLPSSSPFPSNVASIALPRVLGLQP